MRRNSQQYLALANRLPHEMELPVLEVADAAVHQARRATGSSAGKIVALDQRDLESAHRRIARHSATRNAAADHQHIEFLCGNPGHSAWYEWRG